MPITIDEPEVKRMYIGTRFADKVEKGVQNLMIGAASKVQDWSKDQEGIHDDILRLGAGGIKNLRNWSKDQEGVGDDILRLAGGGIGNALKIAGFAGEVGGWAGGKIAGAAGFDPRIGGAIGNVAGDALGGFGAAKALKIGKYTKVIRAMDPIQRGHYAQSQGLIRGGHIAAARAVRKAESLKIAARAVGKETIQEGKDLVSKAVNVVTKQPKVSALDRYDDLVKQGYEVSGSIAKQAEAIRNPNYGKRLKGLKQWTDESAYKKAAQKHYDKTGVSSDIRTKIGVLVNKNGEVFQMKSRSSGPNLSLRSWSEESNTILNRNLSLIQQQAPDVGAHNAPEKVAELMKQMNFKGTAEEFTSKYAIHHKRSIVAYQPFFHNLKGKPAAKLRGMIEKHIGADGVPTKLGNNIENLVAIPKSKHTLDKDSIHTWMRHNAIEGVSKDWKGIVGSYDAQASLRKKFAKASVNQRYKAFKLYLEYVQEPSDDILNKILAAMK